MSGIILVSGPAAAWRSGMSYMAADAYGVGVIGIPARGWRARCSPGRSYSVR